MSWKYSYRSIIKVSLQLRWLCITFKFLSYKATSIIRLYHRYISICNKSTLYRKFVKIFFTGFWKTLNFITQNGGSLIFFRAKQMIHKLLIVCLIFQMYVFRFTKVCRHRLWPRSFYEFWMSNLQWIFTQQKSY